MDAEEDVVGPSYIAYALGYSPRAVQAVCAQMRLAGVREVGKARWLRADFEEFQRSWRTGRPARLTDKVVREDPTLCYTTEAQKRLSPRFKTPGACNNALRRAGVSPVGEVRMFGLVWRCEEVDAALERTLAAENDPGVLTLPVAGKLLGATLNYAVRVLTTAGVSPIEGVLTKNLYRRRDVEEVVRDRANGAGSPVLYQKAESDPRIEARLALTRWAHNGDPGVADEVWVVREAGEWVVRSTPSKNATIHVVRQPWGWSSPDGDPVVRIQPRVDDGVAIPSTTGVLVTKLVTPVRARRQL